MAGALAPGVNTIQAQSQDAFEPPRKRMVEEIAALARETRHETGRASLSARVMEAMAKVPRHEFVPPGDRRNAYANRPLPIGMGQTISQPFIVALMTDLMEIKPGDRVLEIGTGSGYQTALLAELCREVYSVERHAPLARNAEATLARLGYNNVSVIVGDGSQGLPAMAPFDAIVVSAAAPQIPTPLFEQLREGARMVIPVGPPQAQELQLVWKQDGRPTVQSLDGCRFVPLIGGQGYSSSSC